MLRSISFSARFVGHLFIGRLYQSASEGLDVWEKPQLQMSALWAVFIFVNVLFCNQIMKNWNIWRIRRHHMNIPSDWGMTWGWLGVGFTIMLFRMFLQQTIWKSSTKLPFRYFRYRRHNKNLPCDQGWPGVVCTIRVFAPDRCICS